MSARAVQAVLVSRLKSHLKLTAFCIAWHCNDDSGLAWMSKGTLALECSATERSVKRNVQELMTMGVLKRRRKGGGRVTSQYEFDFAVLGSLDLPGSDASVTAAPAEAASGAVDLSGTRTARAVTHTTPQQCRSRPRAVTPASPEKDERKASPSLSSKVAPVSAKPDTHAAARTPPTARPSPVTTTATPMKTKQPPTGEQPKATRSMSVYPWLDDDEALSRRGVELGLQPLPVALAAGMGLGAYMAQAIKRATKAGEPQVRRA